MECDVVVVKTDKAENCLILKLSHNTLNYNNTQYFTQEYLQVNNYKSFHLYVISKIPLKEEEIDAKVCIFKSSNDMITCLAGKGIGRVKTIGQYYPIIATTAIMLTGELAPKPGDYQYFPQVPHYFIQNYVERYNKNNVINEVLVEIELPVIDENPLLSEFSKIKLNNNEISIVADEEKTFTKEQVIRLVMSLTSTPSDISEEAATFIVESYKI
jgi:hypothetical protein